MFSYNKPLNRHNAMKPKRKWRCRAAAAILTLCAKELSLFSIV